jgi:deferrochelatase/peroxidase EfeB
MTSERTEARPGADSGPPDGGPERAGPRLSRRGLLGIAGAGAVAVGATGVGVAAARRDPGGASGAATVPFHGAHQAGIVTPVQDRLHFVAFDLTSDRREELVDLLRTWTDAARRMTAGRDAGPLGAVAGPAEAPPDDTGEALGLPASRLTLTIGFGPSLFRDEHGHDRFGPAGRRPAALEDLPHFPGDQLDPERCGGDVAIQACADDPQVAVHAVRNLARAAFGVAAVRWSQLGFGRTSSTSRAQATPRNLMGFKDGTNNLKAEDGELLDQSVWVQPGDDPAWLRGGSYLVARRIRMTIETWDRTSLAEQQAIIGRFKGSGAPLTGHDEFDGPDFGAKGGDAAPVIRADAHVRLAHPSGSRGAHLLRRGYNFVDGTDGLGRLEAGLFFLAYQRDPRKQFIPVQANLARKDALNEYIRHVGSAVFACPPGVSPDGWWGQSLFA